MGDVPLKTEAVLRSGGWPAAAGDGELSLLKRSSSEAEGPERNAIYRKGGAAGTPKHAPGAFTPAQRRSRLLSEDEKDPFIVDRNTFFDEKPSALSAGASEAVAQATDITERLILKICECVCLIPAPIKYFAKAIFDYHRAAGTDDERAAFAEIAEFLLVKWLIAAMSTDAVLYGLVKTYHLKQNAMDNLQLVGLCMTKIFLLDQRPLDDEVFEPINELAKRLRG